jgi:propionyl-CoA carboxylase alpha chain
MQPSPNTASPNTASPNTASPNTASPIRRLLIANRGEIAVRIARTAHRMGIDTVGVYSEADSESLHVDTVDLAVALGGHSPAESYLRADAVLAAALDTGCDAIHPGYGFLAENADFAEMVIDAGLVWVGPTPGQMRLLGDKVAAKRVAIEAGVPTAPMIEVAPGSIPSDVPMPALVKAAAGGGGRGMRIVHRPDDVAEAVESAAREAESAFGDGTVFIEPYLERGRHIEVQIMGDHHGTVLHLGERECSIQRRNQKIVEESPSAGITPELRAVLCEGALALARHVGYRNAGTVEFLVSEPEGPGATPVVNFLEVNTRLQVEHPVTEAVTGLDLVEMQLRVAGGEPLGLAQDDIAIRGHAIEVRLVAEDPGQGWLPATGRLSAFDLGGAGVRLDTGFRAGATVSPDYDSLLAKVICHAVDRGEAATRLRRALRTADVAGVTTNRDALVAILGDADFLAAATPTSYLDEHPALELANGPDGEDRVALLLGAVFASDTLDRSNAPVTGFAPSGWRNLATRGQRSVLWAASGPAERQPVEVIMCGASNARVLLGPWPEPDEQGRLPVDTRRIVLVRLFDRTSRRQVVEFDGRRVVVEATVVEVPPARPQPGGGAPSADRIIRTRSRAGSVTWQREPRFVVHDAAEANTGGPICPLPGTVIAVLVEPGQIVGEGTLLMVVEAMKMEHKIIAGADAVVADVRFAVGDRVDQGDLLVTFAEPASTAEEAP